MFSFKTDIRSVAASLAGALVLTTTFVGAAIGPARAIETAPVTYAAAAQDGAGINA